MFQACFNFFIRLFVSVYLYLKTFFKYKLSYSSIKIWKNNRFVDMDCTTSSDIVATYLVTYSYKDSTFHLLKTDISIKQIKIVIEQLVKIQNCSPQILAAYTGDVDLTSIMLEHAGPSCDFRYSNLKLYHLNALLNIYNITLLTKDLKENIIVDVEYDFREKS